MSEESGVPDWVSTIFCPTLGLILANIMFASPLKAVYEARKLQDLKSLNPLPWGVILVNCFGWSLYGCMRRDYFVFWSNLPGILLSLFYCLTAIQLLSIRNDKGDKTAIRMMEGCFLGGAAFWGIITMVAGIVLKSSQFEASAELVGYASCVCTVLYYAAPLSTIRNVLLTKDASSLYLPTIFANIVNAILWVAYGSAIGDPIIWAPNFLGIIFSIFQIAICMIYTKWGEVGADIYKKSASMRGMLLSRGESSFAN